MATTEATMDFVTKTTNVFHWADYLVFGAFIFFSLAIGVYYGLIKKQKQETAKDFLMGGKDMQVTPSLFCRNPLYIPSVIHGISERRRSSC